jgi:hypothetical protein
MATFSIPCSLFDPVRLTTSATADSFVFDTWYESGLITQAMHTRLPGIPVDGTGQVMMSSGMSMTRPYLHLGIQVNELRVVPLRFYVVDNGPAPVLLATDFLRALFLMGVTPPSPTGPVVSFEPPAKRDPQSIAVRLIPSERESIQTRELERFISGVRRLHNCAHVVVSRLHQHADWNPRDREGAKREAVRHTVLDDASLSTQDRLTIGWIESGSVWLTLASGTKAGLAWLAQIFKLSMDARLERALSTAATARERAILEELTRDDIANAKQAELRFKRAKANRQEREEWRRMILGEIDFRRAVARRVEDPTVREEVIAQIDRAVADLVEPELLPLVEHVPDISIDENLVLSVRDGEDQDDRERPRKK